MADSRSTAQHGEAGPLGRRPFRFADEGDGSAAPTSVDVPVTTGDGGAPAEPPREQGMVRTLLEFAVLCVVAFAVAWAIKTWIVQPFYIPSGSMIPTLLVGDRVLVNKFIYRFDEPAPKDVVVFSSVQTPGQDLIKRVIAVEGQTVDIRDGYVYVDGAKLDEPYVAAADRDAYNLPAPITIPKGSVWVMGDNRANSADSRVFGPLPVVNVLGKAFVVYWPFERVKGL